MGIDHQYWIEESTGGIWAVELEDGAVTGCYGPMALAEADDDLLETYDYSGGGAAWINAHRERFTHITLEIPDFPAT